MAKEQSLPLTLTPFRSPAIPIPFHVARDQAKDRNRKPGALRTMDLGHWLLQLVVHILLGKLKLRPVIIMKIFETFTFYCLLLLILLRAMATNLFYGKLGNFLASKLTDTRTLELTQRQRHSHLGISGSACRHCAFGFCVTRTRISIAINVFVWVSPPFDPILSQLTRPRPHQFMLILCLRNCFLNTLLIMTE